MKTGKKFLSLLLAMLMLVTTLPLAMAANIDTEVTYPFPHPILDPTSVTGVWTEPDTIRLALPNDSWAENNVTIRIIHTFTIVIPVSDESGGTRYTNKEIVEQIPIYKLVYREKKAADDSSFDIYFKAWPYGNFRLDIHGNPYPRHAHTFLYDTIKEVTCDSDEEGEIRMICQDPDCNEVVRYVMPGGHIYDKWKTRIYETCTDGEVKTHTCARCGKVETVIGGMPIDRSVIQISDADLPNPPKGHNYVFAGTVARNCGEEGYDKYVCDNDIWHIDADGREWCDTCGKIDRRKIVAPTGEHADKDLDEKCDVCGKYMPITKPDYCPFCGEVHTGIFGKVIRFFHNWLFKVFGAKKDISVMSVMDSLIALFD